VSITWEAITAIFTAVGAVGTLIAAVAAWASARASRGAAKDARDALGLALRPGLQLDTIRLPEQSGGTSLFGRIMPTGPFGASEITAVWRMRDGKSVTGSWTHLEGWRPDFPPGTENSLRVALPDDAESLAFRVEVRFADERHVCRWRQVFERGEDPMVGWLGSPPTSG
jgi:hypothetical protein